MGQLLYGNAPAIRIDDWALAHLQAVIITKLRRDEAFTFSWADEDGIAGVVSGGKLAKASPGMIWISRSSALYFSFDTDRDRPLNRRWLVDLVDLANGSGGLRLLPEPQ